MRNRSVAMSHEWIQPGPVRSCPNIVLYGYLFIVCACAGSAVAWSAEVDDAAADLPIEPASIELGRPVDFDLDVYPILESNCVSCHNVITQEGGLVVENVASLLAGGDSGPAVVPKDPDESLLYRLAARMEESYMPPLPNDVRARSLTPDEVGLLRTWILEGAKQGSGPTEADIQWRPLPSHLQAIHSVAISPDERFIASGRANHVDLIDGFTGEKLFELVDPHLSGVMFEGKPMYGDGAAHRDFVHCLAFSPDGNQLASGGYRVVKIWQRPMNATTFQKEFGQSITALASQRHATKTNRVVVGLEDGSIQILRTEDQVIENQFAAHPEKVTDLCLGTDNQILVSASADRQVRVWELNSATLVDEFTTSSISSIVVSEPTRTIITGHLGGTIRIWKVPDEPVEIEQKEGDKLEPAEEGAIKDGDAVSGKARESRKPLLELNGDATRVSTLALWGNEEQELVSGGAEGKLRFWNLKTGKELKSFEHGSPIVGVATHPQSDQIASVDQGGHIVIWDSKGKRVGEISGTIEQSFRIEHLETELEVAQQRLKNAQTGFEEADKELTSVTAAVTKAIEERAASAKSVVEAEAKAEKALADLEQANLEQDNQANLEQANQANLEQANKANLEQANRANLEQANKVLEQKPGDEALKKKQEALKKASDKEAASAQQARDAMQIAVRNVELAAAAQRSSERRREAARESKDRESLAKEGLEKDLASVRMERVESKMEVVAIEFSPKGKVLATLFRNGSVQTWNARNAQPVEAYAGRADADQCLVFRGEHQLVTGSSEGLLTEWDLQPAWYLEGQLGPIAEAPLDLKGSQLTDRVLAVDFSPNGKQLATGGGAPSQTGELILWDLEGMTRIRKFSNAHSDTVFGVEFSHDGKFLLSGGADKLAKVFEVETGNLLRAFEGHTNHVLAVSWKADGSSMITAGADHVIKFWEIDSGSQIRTISNYSKQVTSAEFVGTGDNMISCSGDKNIRFHNPSSGKNFRSFSGATDYVYGVTATDDLGTVVAGGEDGVLRVWNGNDGKLRYEVKPPQHDR